MHKSALILFTFLFAACGPMVREVKRTPTGGELALLYTGQGPRDDADKLMAARCPQGYDVLEEGEVVVGQTVNENTNQHQRTSYFGPAQQTTRTTDISDKKEWRIVYQCKGIQGVHELLLKNY